MSMVQTNGYGMSATQRFIVKLTALVVVGTIVIVALVSMRANRPHDQFSISGEGRVFAVPDIAEITLGVRVENAATAEDATRKGVTQMNRVTEALVTAGVPKKDIQTTNYSLFPAYNYTADRGQQLTGWTLDQSVRLKVRALDRIGDVISAATAAGANQAGGIAFTIDDPEALKAEARTQAIEKAKEKAKQLAAAAGVRLGKVTTLYEAAGSTPYASYRSYDLAAEGMGGGGMPAPSIEAGQNEIVVTMTLVYEIK